MIGTMPFDGVVKAIARQWKVPGMDRDDLFQEGRMVALKAIAAYSPDCGCSKQQFVGVFVKRRFATLLKLAMCERRRSSNGGVSMETRPPDAASTWGELLRSNEDITARVEALDDLRMVCSMRLSSSERVALGVLFNGESYRDAANRTGLPEKSIDNAIQRLRRKSRLAVAA